MSRALARKIDPTTGDIYSPYDNPVPENDKKIMDRLTPIELDQDALQKKLEIHNEMSHKFLEWYDRFGLVMRDPNTTLDELEPVEFHKRQKLVSKPLFVVENNENTDFENDI